MVETLFKLGCLMCVCFIAVAYLFLAFEKESTATRHATPLSVAPAETSAVAREKEILSMLRRTYAAGPGKATTRTSTPADRKTRCQHTTP